MHRDPAAPARSRRPCALGAALRALLTGAALLVLTPAALAQRAPARPAPPASVDPTALEAQRAYDAGRAATAAGQHEAALENFQRAFTLRASPVVLVSIAAAQESLGRVPDAIATLERFLSEAPSAAPERAAATERLNALRQRPAELLLESEPAGAHVLVDGVDTGQVTPATVPLSAGAHALRLELAGHLAQEAQRTVAPGQRETLRLELAAEPPPPPPVPVTPEPEPAPVAPEPEPQGPSPAVWAAGGLSVAGVVSGTVFGLLALGELGTYNATGMATREGKDRGETYALVADVSFATAILAAGVGIVVFTAQRSGDTTAGNGAAARRAPTPRVRVGLTGLALQF